MLEYNAPVVPLSSEDFLRAVRIGHGRAWMHLDATTPQDPSLARLLDATTECGVYDPQVEGLPVKWTVDLCERAGLVDQVIHGGPGAGPWDNAWRCELLSELARRGREAARKALYLSCEPNADGDLVAAEWIVDLDGLDGLIFVAQKVGSLVLKGVPVKVEQGLLDEFDSDHGSGTAAGSLAPLAARDPAIAKFLSSLRTQEPGEHERARPARLTVEEALAQVRASKTRHLGLGYWGKHAQPADLSAFMEIALSSGRPLVIENALRALSQNKEFPFQPELLPLVRHEDLNVREFAAKTLGLHTHELVRKTGLALLGLDMPVALELLVHNAKEDDGATIAKQLRPINDVHQQHGVCFDLVRILEVNEAILEPRLALYVYEYSPCRNCRADAVECLVDWGVCPKWLYEEGRLDACGDVRKALEEVEGQT